MRPAAILVALALASVGSGVSEEHWWPAFDGSVQSIVSGRGERPSLFVLTREVREGDGSEDDSESDSDTDSDSDSDDERRWSIQRWDPASPGLLTPLIDLPASKVRPQLDFVATSPSGSLSLVIGSDLWLLPIDEIEAREGRALGRPSFTDPSSERRLLQVDPRAARAFAAGIGEAEIFNLVTLESIRLRLPTDVRPRKTGLSLKSPPLQVLGDEALFTIGPQSLANLRLRTILVEADWAMQYTDDPGFEAPPPNEAWSLLPGPEHLQESRYEWIDGKPFLFCVTLRADKQGIFEKKKVRIFELQPDRTRAGSSPHFEYLTSSRMWQPLGMHLVDVDRDSTRDLVLLQPEGLGGKKLIVEVFLGLSGGRFDDRAFRTVIPDLGWGHYGADWTGDSIPDLAAARGNTIEIYAGAAKLKKKSVIDREPTHTFQIGSPETTLRRLRQHGPWFVARGSGSEGSLVVIEPRP